MSSDIFEYPGIIHGGPVQTWQKTVYPESGSLMFAFSGPKADYCEVRNALTHHYGREAFDAMRKLKQTDSAYSMIVEAHFARPMDRLKELSKALLKNDPVTMWIHNKNANQGTRKVKYKIFPSVPILGPFTVYRIDNLPLGASAEICAIVKKQVIVMLMNKLVKYEKKDVVQHLIDILPGYDDDGDTHLFDGTVSVVLKDFIGVYLQFDSIVLFGKLFKPVTNSAHYAYCKGCRVLDSHLVDDCPHPSRSAHI